MDDGLKAMVKMATAEETAALKRERWARAVAFDLMA
jgi:hypothetical protein